VFSEGLFENKLLVFVVGLFPNKLFVFVLFVEGIFPNMVLVFVVTFVFLEVLLPNKLELELGGLFILFIVFELGFVKGLLDITFIPIAEVLLNRDGVVCI
jgi:hypothetical protein